MSISASENLLCCNTLRDWGVVRSELPHLFRCNKKLNVQQRNLILYFAMQNAIPFHVCTVFYRKNFLILHGQQELQALLEFMFLNVPVNRQLWPFPLHLPGKTDLVTISDFSYEEQCRILSTKIPHCDFNIDSAEDMNMLHSYYTSFASSSSCSPILKSSG